MNRPSFVALMALASVAIVGCGKGGGNVATVNGDPITKEEFHRYLELKPSAQVIIDLTTFQVPPGQRQVTVTAPVYLTMGFQGLNDLVQRRVMEQEAKDAGVAPTKADIDKELDFQEQKSKKQQRDFIKELNNQGFTLDEIRNNIIATDLLKRNLVTKGIVVSPTEVDDFIKNNPNQFKDPEQALLQMIVVVGKENEDKAKNDLMSGQNFVAVAQKYSVQENGSGMGYHFPQTVVSQFPQKLRETIAPMREGQQTDWIPQSNNQFIKFYVEKKSPEKARTIDDTTKEEVRRFLATDRGNKAIDLNQRLQTRLLASKIEIEDPALKDQWTRQMDQLRNSIKNKEAAVAAAAPTSGAPAGTTNGATTPPAATPTTGGKPAATTAGTPK